MSKRRALVVHTRLLPSEYASLMSIVRKSKKTKAAVIRSALMAYCEDRLTWQERLRGER